MNESRDAPIISPELLAIVPETLAEAEALALSIEQAVQHETGHGITNLSVEVRSDGICLHGSCGSFYCKQLAQHAAMAVSGAERLTNSIEVD